jgi:hypothetical protein
MHRRVARRVRCRLLQHKGSRGHAPHPLSHPRPRTRYLCGATSAERLCALVENILSVRTVLDMSSGQVLGAFATGRSENVGAEKGDGEGR